jgi:alkylated DNA repair protein alkB family protein 1
MTRSCSPADSSATAEHQGGTVCIPTSEFVPDAALVNYYQAGDTLNGHKDDVERDLQQPIVTVSLGCDAIFLVGGTTRCGLHRQGNRTETWLQQRV